MDSQFLKASLIIYNCRIYPFSFENPALTALAVSGERILASGSDAEILALAAPDTTRVNGAGRWLLPGFIDSHTHLTGYALRSLEVDLSDCQSLSEAVSRIQERVKQTPQGGWITGGGWDKNVWGLTDFPDKSVLDAISTRHFIALSSKDWHTMWVNSPVLKRMGITVETAQPEGGEIRRYPDRNEPMGILHEKAREPVFKMIPSPSEEDLRKALRRAFSHFHRLGITAVGSMETPREWSLYQRLLAENQLPLRIFYYFPADFLEQAIALKLHSGLGNAFLKMCGVKLFADGALGSQTAAMLENYEQLQHKGIETLSRKQLSEIVGRSVHNFLACAVHAIGDRANRNVLRALEVHAAESQRRHLRHRIEHAQLLHPDDIPLFGKLNVVASVQPIHLAADIPIVRKYWGERGRFAYAFGSLVRGGACLAFGSDTPIESFDPWAAIYTALRRKYQCQPEAPAFYPEEAISLQEAIGAYTRNGAYAVGEEQRLGTVRPGYLADMILIDKDIFNSPPEILLETSVWLTIVNGQIVHRLDPPAE